MNAANSFLSHYMLAMQFSFLALLQSKEVFGQKGQNWSQVQ